MPWRDRGGVKLRKTHTEVGLEDLWVRAVDGMRLVGIFCDIGDVGEVERLAVDETRPCAGA